MKYVELDFLPRLLGGEKSRAAVWLLAIDLTTSVKYFQTDLN